MQAFRNSFNGGNLEHTDSHFGLQTGQEAAGQRMVLDCVHQGEDQGVVPTPDVGHVEDGRQALLDHSGRS